MDNLVIKKTANIDRIVDLAESFEINIHNFENVVTSWEAFLNDQFIGGVILRFDGENYQVDLTSVKEEHQRNGVGTQLMNTLINEVKSRGGTAIYVITRHALGFYEKLGFNIINDIPDALFMCGECDRYDECSPTFLKLDLL